MQSMLYEVQPSDPVTLGSVAAILELTTVCAAILPARRALRVDPIVTLRTG